MAHGMDFVMKHEILVVFSGLAALLLLAGCASQPERILSDKVPKYATLPNGHEPLDPTVLSGIYADAMSAPGETVVRYLERRRGHALNILSLSGGGQNGAFGAGSTLYWCPRGMHQWAVL